VTATARRSTPAGLPVLAWATLAVVGWTMIAWLAVQLFAAKPPSAGFDLELLLKAGRDVAAGRSPYDPALLGGAAPDATGLFFSYPPLVAQALAPFAGIPSGLMFAAWAAVAVGSLVAVTEQLRRVTRPAVPSGTVAIAIVAVASLTFPFVVAVLFGNLDAFFPALYGLALVAAVSPSRRDQVVGGLAIAIAALAKLYPAGLGLWFAIRALRAGRGRRAEGRRLAVIVASGLASGIALFALSIVVGGLGPWREYLTVAGVASQAELVDPKNVGPAAQLALLVGADSGLARAVHVGVAGAAVLVIVWAAWRRRDRVESLAIAAAATLVLLPVSWIHYPAAMIPFGAAAVLRSTGRPSGRRAGLLAAAAVLMAVIALAWLPLMWLAVLLCLAAVHVSAEEGATDADRVEGDAGGASDAEDAAPLVSPGAAVR
jgi:hypothetical protein